MTPSRNLVLVHTPDWQDIADFHAIKAHVESMAPDIEVFVVSNPSRSSVTSRKAAQRPSLIFSPVRLLDFRPRRGRLYAGQPMSKLDEMRRLAASGLPVPAFEEIGPQTALSRDSYGPYVIVKPSYALASWGQNIELLPTDRVRYRAPSDYPADHLGRYAPMIAQKFVDCGYAMTCRVLTLFGVPLFTYWRQSTRPLTLDPSREPFQPADYMPAPPDMTAHVTRDPAMLALAAAAWRAMPMVALQACDILRDKDGGLHLLEINPGGGAWAFSNRSAPGYRKRLGVDDLSSFFDAFRTAAQLLVERTRTEAV